MNHDRSPAASAFFNSLLGLVGCEMPLPSRDEHQTLGLDPRLEAVSCSSSLLTRLRDLQLAQEAYAVVAVAIVATAQKRHSLVQRSDRLVRASTQPYRRIEIGRVHVVT